MGYNKMFFQKLLFASFLTIVNSSLVSLCYVFSKSWYLTQIPLLFIFSFQMISILLIFVLSLFKKDRRLSKQAIKPCSMCYFIPCYNESQQEINNTLESFIAQTQLQIHNKIYTVVCDGRKLGAGNNLTTDKILSKLIFPNSQSIVLSGGYINDCRQQNEIQILLGQTSNKCPYFVIVKGKNQGKRDSIGIIRRLCYNFNLQNPDCRYISKQMLSIFKGHLQKYGIKSIDHIVGVDADTVFASDCTIQMLREIERKQNILATTGMVKVQFTANTCFGKIMECYQHVEYISGQGFMRNQQNLTQQKINCLPGCLNTTRVCQKTCGEQLLSIYLKPPIQDDHIFQWIRGTASQDRHSVMLLLMLYGDCHTTCTWDAQAITSVPITPSVFLSQRKRWSLGSATHGLWMVFMENIPLFERISTLVFVLTYVLTPFFMYSLVLWILTMARQDGDKIFWTMTALVQIITVYKLSIGIWVKLSKIQKALYFLTYPLYYICGPFVGICVWSYSLYNMDDFGWGKTRTIVETAIESSILSQQKSEVSVKKHYSQMSTTMEAINPKVQLANILINDQILEQVLQEREQFQHDFKLKNRSFQQSRVMQITLVGKRTRQALAPLFIDNNTPLISNRDIQEKEVRIKGQNFQTHQNPNGLENKSTNQEYSIVLFSDTNETDTYQADIQNAGQTTAPMTQRFKKVKIIEFK